jgi:hypothetical protein
VTNVRTSHNIKLYLKTALVQKNSVFSRLKSNNSRSGRYFTSNIYCFIKIISQSDTVAKTARRVGGVRQTEKIAGQARNLFHLRNSPRRPHVISINSFAEKMQQSGLRDFRSSAFEKKFPFHLMRKGYFEKKHPFHMM